MSLRTHPSRTALLAVGLTSALTLLGATSASAATVPASSVRAQLRTLVGDPRAELAQSGPTPAQAASNTYQRCSSRVAARKAVYQSASATGSVPRDAEALEWRFASTAAARDYQNSSYAFDVCQAKAAHRTYVASRRTENLGGHTTRQANFYASGTAADLYEASTVEQWGIVTVTVTLSSTAPITAHDRMQVRQIASNEMGYYFAHGWKALPAHG